jgi:hypothetical protein
MVPGAVVVTDNHAQTGYYAYANAAAYNYTSVKVDSYDYSPTTSLADCLATHSSFFYDTATTKLYIHIKDDDALLSKEVIVGKAFGFAYNSTNNYVNDFYYAPIINSVPTLKNAVDPTFYGLQKYNPIKVGLINTDGNLDDWESRNLFGQAARIYVDGTLRYSGFIENYTQAWDSLDVTIQDLRKGLSQPVATRKLDATTYPHMDTSLFDEVIPVAYGKVTGIKSNCVDINASSPTYNTFIICDTTYNAVTSLDAVYVDKVLKTAYNVNLTAGTFQLLHSDVVDNADNVVINFTMPITDSVSIIKDLMFRYDGKPFIASFWDLTEVNAIGSLSLHSYLFIDDDSSLAKAVEKMCIDSSLRMFVHDNGTYTIRAYNAARTPIATIPKADFMDAPAIANNASEYLTSCIIKYGYNKEADTWLQYENTLYQDAAYYKYKKLTSKTYETNLTDLAGATAKSNVIMDWSSNVRNIITRKTSWQYSNIEMTDFVICDPVSRISQAETRGVYEVLSVSKDPNKGEVVFTMRYVTTDPTINCIYSALTDNTGAYVNDNNMSTILTIRTA